MGDSLHVRRNEFLERSRRWKPESLHELFFRKSTKYKDRDYIITRDKRLTYGEVGKKVESLANGLYKVGVSARDHIAMIMPNYAEFIIAKLAISFTNSVTVPLNYRLKREELKYLITQSDSNFIITIDEFQEVNYISLLKELVPEVFNGEQSTEIPKLKKIIVFSPKGKRYEGTTDLTDLINEKNDEYTDELYELMKQIDVSDVSDIVYTSGTTSLPKGALVTHDMVWRSSIGSCVNRAYQDGRKVFIPLPFFHIFGYIEGISSTTMVGGTIIPQEIFNPEEALDLMEEYEANDISCIPTIALKLLEEQRANPRNLEYLTAMYCAGAEVSKEMWQAIKDTLKIDELITGYGMTEIASGVLQTDPSDDLDYLVKYVGKTLPGGHIFPDDMDRTNIEFKIFSHDTEEYVGYGVEGELVCRGPPVTQGYYKNKQETADSFDEAGWFRTGDIAVIHENGYISLTGRLNEIYRVGAENVAPKEIEDVLNSHPKINQAYVIGVPDEVMGEVGMAWVIPHNRVKLTPDEILKYTSGLLARFKIPKYVKFVNLNELPLTSSGKVQKFKLKELYKDEKLHYEKLF